MSFLSFSMMLPSPFFHIPDSICGGAGLMPLQGMTFYVSIELTLRKKVVFFMSGSRRHTVAVFTACVAPNSNFSSLEDYPTFLLLSEIVIMNHHLL